MTRDDIIRMAREAGFTEGDISLFPDLIVHFAALVAAAEREAIAKSLDKQADLACDEIDRQWAQEMAAAVRARGDNE